ncbi:Ig-like domain-containing protein [Fodinisporobacter ferrooxydans]|uniref:Ig-like domain-containing protein n=1 Tax=Fodinisporobacter ferrooxydans TaxID=2901836 RepID=A0ABY4CHA6_9BACL|nr:Ig-like domain-containing protein [Alicyclobacillaceae bacterium MYW30-H2]
MKFIRFRWKKHFAVSLLILSSFSGVTYADTTTSTTTAAPSIEKMYLDDQSNLHIVTHSVLPGTVGLASAQLVEPNQGTVFTLLKYDKTSDSWIPRNALPLQYGEWKCKQIQLGSQLLDGNFVFYRSPSPIAHPWYVDVNHVNDTDSVLTGFSVPGATITVTKNGQTLGSGTVGEDGTFSISIGKQLANSQLRIFGKNGGNPVDIGVTVQSTAAAIPLTVHPFTEADWAVRGSVTAGSAVVVISGDKTLGTGTANLDGSFTINIPAQKVGTPFMVYAKDATGTTSGLQEIVVQPTAPETQAGNTNSANTPSVKGAANGAAAQSSIMPQTGAAVKVSVNGKALTFDTPPVIDDNYTLVPVRGIFEALGAKVEWENGTIRMFKDTHTVLLEIGSKTAAIDGKIVQLDIAPKIINDRAFVPVRFISEAFGAKVSWDPINREAMITLQ